MEEITLTQTEFQERYIAHFLSLLDPRDKEIAPYSTQELAENFAEVAWGEEAQRHDGPEVSAESDISYLMQE